MILEIRLIGIDSRLQLIELLVRSFHSTVLGRARRANDTSASKCFAIAAMACANIVTGVTKLFNFCILITLVCYKFYGISYTPVSNRVFSDNKFAFRIQKTFFHSIRPHI